ncbi:hypothetical protein CRYUN_Cryun23aG0097900 [Craigia yunnanensis]
MLKCLTPLMRVSFSPLLRYVHEFQMRNLSMMVRRMLHAQKFPLLLVLKILIIAMEMGSEMGEMHGAKSKMNPRFSFDFHHIKEFHGLLFQIMKMVSTKAGEVPKRLKANDHGTLEDHSIPELHEDFNGKEESS